jgi:hypothetical protein
MNKLLTVCCLFICCAVSAQKGDELLVYSLTGNVTVVENNAESRVKIGKVLKPGSMIKTQKQAKLTLVCKQGKPITISEQGNFPVDRWKDSCETSNNSMTTKYFQFIWDQLYVRSDEYKKDHPGDDGSMIAAPSRGQEEVEIMINQWMDTVYYTGGNFPISWTTSNPYDGKYFFRFYDARSKKLLFTDSVWKNNVDLAKLKKYMKLGSLYYWQVSASRTIEGEGGAVKYVTTAALTNQVNKLKKSVNVPEDPAMQNFRTAYLLQETGYLPAALQYYQRAARISPAVDFYSDKLKAFKKDFNLQ